MKFFYLVNSGSQILSSICQWNSVKLLRGLYSDFDKPSSYKNKLKFIDSPLSFIVFFQKSEVHFYR